MEGRGLFDARGEYSGDTFGRDEVLGRSVSEVDCRGEKSFQIKELQSTSPGSRESGQMSSLSMSVN